MDIDGQAWENPPSIGCDEWHPEPTVVIPPSFHWIPGTRTLIWNAAAFGRPPFYYSWIKDGVTIAGGGRFSNANSTNLEIRSIDSADAGGYAIVVTNSFGTVTSVVAQVVIHCVDQASTSPVSPYANWATAATNIQHAIDFASPGAIILVTNGVYATGGKVMAGDLTNRVALDKSVVVQSVNGPTFTAIHGLGATNGLEAVRCAWLANDAVLGGFTLRAGATRLSGDVSQRSGGGAWCASSNAVIANCLITGNTADQGGGTYQGLLFNCAVISNSAAASPGGSYFGKLNNCTVTGNTAASTAGVSQSTLTNCIVYFNSPGTNYDTSTFRFSCTTPLPSGAGNLAADPQLSPGAFDLDFGSPCRAAGTNIAALGLDLYGQPWADPPSMGCVESQYAPLLRDVAGVVTIAPLGFRITAALGGLGPMSVSWLRNGIVVQTDSLDSQTRSSVLRGAGVQSLDGASYQVVVSNAFGVITGAVTQMPEIHYVNATNSLPTSPFNSWATAATNIQDAIETTPPGGIVLVANGLYGTGGKVMSGDLTNRVALDKPIVVASIEGPAKTIIEGASALATIGPAAVRCAWLTNGAALSGFTLRGGATRATGAYEGMQGGGVWCAGTESSIEDCHMIGNACAWGGGGAYQGNYLRCRVFRNLAAGTGGGGGMYLATATDCEISENSAPNRGGGVVYTKATNCAIIRNTSGRGGGAYSSDLIHCTVCGNFANTGGGVDQTSLINSIVYGNNPTNYISGFFTYSCSTPLPAGDGNISADPQLLPDSIHLAPASPCIGAGTNLASITTDLDGQPRANPPTMGCDEWRPEPVAVIAPNPEIMTGPLRFTLSSTVAGQVPFDLWWQKSGQALSDNSHYGGTTRPSLTISNLAFADKGNYQLMVSNAFGISTSAVFQLDFYCVNAATTNPVNPYLTWETAATTIQQAIDIAPSWSIILVTNGVYATGARSSSDGASNRIVVPRPMTLAGVNGPEATIIRGAWDPVSTNGPLAVRCAYLAADARLSGFTLEGGAAMKSPNNQGSGGGVMGESVKPVASDCIVRGNFGTVGGGGYRVLFDRCKIIGNIASAYGGGAHSCTIQNSLVRSNSASAGGGVNSCTVLNSTIVENTAGFGGGVGGIPPYCYITNSVIYHNLTIPYYASYANWYGYSGTFSYSCTTPLPSGGIGNITDDPQILDGQHLAATSPCIGTGSALFATGTDLDQQPWANPPPMGCDQYVEADNVGPLDITLSIADPIITEARNTRLYATITGRANRVTWDFGDGSTLTNMSLVSVSHAWTNPGNYTITVPLTTSTIPQAYHKPLA